MATKGAILRWRWLFLDRRVRFTFLLSMIKFIIHHAISMKAHAESTVSDEMFSKRAERWAVDTPDTKEAYWIREIFEGP